MYLGALQQIGLERQLEVLGFNGRDIGLIIGRMVRPGSELATHEWLQQHSGLGELLGYDFATTSLSHLYRVPDQLLAHQAALERYLYEQERDLWHGSNQGNTFSGLKILNTLKNNK